MLIYTIGDIHGCLDQFKALLGQIEAHHGGKPHRIITLGDYVDRGPDSKGVLDLLMARPDIVRLMGNHERMLLDAYWEEDSWSVQDFLSNGGHETLASFGAPTPQHIPQEYIRFLNVDLMLSAEDERRFYVHAGINPNFKLDDQIEAALIWMREPFLSCGFAFEKYIVHGHTPQEGKADVRANRTNLDTGCCWTGVLAAGVFDDTQDKPIDILYARA